MILKRCQRGLPYPDTRKAIVPWLVVLVVIMAAGAAISIATWPANRPTQTLWFWGRTFGLPFLAWQLAYSGWRFLNANRLQNALADNAAIDRKAQQLHAEASVPLVVIGQSWCFSGGKGQGSIEEAVRVREPEELTGLVIPDRPFFQGNRADEARRHSALLEWLLVELISSFVHELNNSPSTTVWLRLDSILPSGEARAAIGRAWTTLGLRLPENVRLPESMTLYAIDQWLDKNSRTSRHLAIAIQLRCAISGGMQTGQAEAGAAVLLGGDTSLAGLQDATAVVCAYRPARRGVALVGDGVAQAMRWGCSAGRSVETLWNSGQAEPLTKAFKSLGGPVNRAPTIELARTIGDAGVATPWFALAVAAAKAKDSGGAQLILDQQDNDLIAMVCRKKI